MKQLAKAVELAARANEADNPVHANSLRIAASLKQRGVPEAAARRAAETRIFSNTSAATAPASTTRRWPPTPGKARPKPTARWRSFT